VCSLYDMGVIKTKKEEKLSLKQIKNNLSELKSKLSSSPSLLHKELYNNLKKVSYHDLKWNDYLANKIISDDSDAVKKLTQNYDIFMEPKRQMLPSTLPFIQGMCERFVSRFTEPQEYYPPILMHDKTWKESNDILSGLAEEVLKVLGESWKNPAFSPELRSSQNEGTYVTHVIAPSIRAVLKDLPFGKSSYISMAEKKSVASSERKGEGHLGKKPDMMFILNREEVSYELVYAEFSRLVCTDQKNKKDDIKLWRETNDGMDWVRNKCKPAKDEADVHRYYHLKSVEIPVQPTNEVVVAEFIHTLLILRVDKDQFQDLSSDNYNISSDISCNTEITNEQDSLSVSHIISTNDLCKLKKEEALIQEISLEKNYTNENLSSDREKKPRFQDLSSNNNSLETNPKD
ncbi:13609_t:CDS:2, partial [Racocetra persica]